ARGQSRPRRCAQALDSRDRNGCGPNHPAGRRRDGGVNVARASVRSTLLCVSLACGYGPIAAAQTSVDLVGRWRLTLEAGNAEHSGVLEIERDGNTLQAFVDGGPVVLDVDA